MKFALVLAVLSITTLLQAADPVRPNVIVILADDKNLESPGRLTRSSQPDTSRSPPRPKPYWSRIALTEGTN
jgi:hypothetical protein